jgi:hypothetical protein
MMGVARMEISDIQHCVSAQARLAMTREYNAGLAALFGIIAVALSACGGGGGSSGNSNGPTYQNAATTVTLPSYTVADSQTIATALSAIRGGSGAGLLVQNSALDQAAGAHSSYLITNNKVADVTYLTSLVSGTGILGAHYEAAAGTGFTGAAPQDRAAVAGFSGSVTELISFGAASGAACITSQQNSVYHLLDLLSAATDLGLSFNAGNGSDSVCTLILGTPGDTLGQLPASGLVTYPYDAQMAVPPTYYNRAEVPNPAVDLAKAGHPVAVSLYTQAHPTLTGSDIVVTDFSMTDANGAAVSARILAATGVKAGGTLSLTSDVNLARAGTIVLLPVAPLTASTDYTVSFAATVKGGAVSKTWTFTTGAAN